MIIEEYQRKLDALRKKAKDPAMTTLAFLAGALVSGIALMIHGWIIVSGSGVLTVLLNFSITLCFGVVGIKLYHYGISKMIDKLLVEYSMEQKSYWKQMQNDSF